MEQIELAETVKLAGLPGDRRVAQRHKGTGLGMPLTLGLMQLHDGTVLLESQLGVGSTVTLRLPADRLVPALAAAS